MPERKKIHCNACKRETHHELKSTHNKDDADVDESGQLIFYENIQYGFYVCCGCDTATLEEKYHCSGMYYSNGEEAFSYTYYPARNNSNYREPKRFVHIDSKLKSAYIEIIKASNQGLGILNVMGIRALLEGICLEEGIDDKEAWGLEKKIEKLKTKSNIPESIISALVSLKITGDDAAHRLMAKDMRSVNLAIDVLEALLTHLYEAKFDLERKAELVRQHMPQK